jgi:hypothetical protein
LIHQVMEFLAHRAHSRILRAADVSAAYARAMRLQPSATTGPPVSTGQSRRRGVRFGPILIRSVWRSLRSADRLRRARMGILDVMPEGWTLLSDRAGRWACRHEARAHRRRSES